MSALRLGTIRRIVLQSAVFAAVSASKPAFACPVCFGALEGPIADATNKAILVLLGVTVGVLAAFATFFVYLYRRARIAAAPGVEALQSTGRAQADVIVVREGTA